MRHISDRANDMICIGIILMEILAAVVYRSSISYSLAAKHTDQAMDIPLLMLYASVLIQVAMRVWYAHKKWRTDWVMFLSMSLIPWSYVLYVIGCHTPCCTGG